MAPGKNIQSTVGYWEPFFDSDQRPWTFTRPIEEEERERYPTISSKVEMVESTIHDGRQHHLRLDQNGFERIDSVTSLEPADFLDDEKLKNVYFKEVEREMKRITGAEDVIVWNHFIRFGTFSISDFRYWVLIRDRSSITSACFAIFWSPPVSVISPN